MLSGSIILHCEKRGVITCDRAYEIVYIHIIKGGAGCICKTGKGFYNYKILSSFAVQNALTENFPQAPEIQQPIAEFQRVARNGTHKKMAMMGAGVAATLGMAYVIAKALKGKD